MDAGILVASRNYSGDILVAIVYGAQNLVPHHLLLCRRYLHDFSVVGQDAVALLFHISNLCVNRHPQALLLLQFAQAVGIAVIEVCIGLSILDSCIVHVGTGPHMILDEEVDASELATRSYALVDGIRGGSRGGVGVDIEEVAHLDIYPSRHSMNESTWVVIGIHNAVDSPHGMSHASFCMLSPAFVPYHPSTDARMVTCGLDEFFVLAIEVLHGILDIAYRTTAAA